MDVLFISGACRHRCLLAVYLWAFLPMRVTIAPEEAFAGWLHERLAAARARAVQAGQQR